MKARGFNYLVKITAVDYTSYVELVYILYNLSTKAQEIVKVKLQPNGMEVETVMPIFSAADWYERELSEMFGIRIKGRNARRLLLEEWDGVDAPLMKSFVWGTDYKRQS
jgi:NADH-quinone oxidoreductase subunit C